MCFKKKKKLLIGFQVLHIKNTGYKGFEARSIQLLVFTLACAMQTAGERLYGSEGIKVSGGY